ncbi:serine/arginine rich splicing factor [Holotrichia oblita]|uniref:Serine/arginine rich splicing factor n=3 Tax=Holotrichia oblita TaxID=644536 RepID=A0ACB9T2Z7_HOLOL|nr:serine/arginine rich splicing factor [Holotrichia oblita]KAI4461184.1 serine/arginine rich splicing factor [Holotrichia oblita]KAI4461189.1 serine/arginine rich splicing factor [Holotrichia oblita]
MSRYNSDCKVYVGDLGNNASKQELEDAFGYYGPLRNVWVARNPPGFAFVEFEDPRDAEDAIRGLDGRTICGRRARVEMSNGKNGGGRYRGPPPRSRGRPFHPDDRCYECGDRGHYARDYQERVLEVVPAIVAVDQEVLQGQGAVHEIVLALDLLLVNGAGLAAQIATPVLDREAGRHLKKMVVQEIIHKVSSS